MGGEFPAEQTYHAVLEDKRNSNSTDDVRLREAAIGRSACLALKRRKLFDMTGKLKLGRSTYFLDRLSLIEESSGISCEGKTCWRSLSIKVSAVFGPDHR